jgi:hypothetical protein
MRQLNPITARAVKNPSFLTVVIFCRKESYERRDALSVLRVVEVVAPSVEGSVLLRVVARQRIRVPGAGVEWWTGDNAGDVDVGQAVGKVLEVDVEVIASHLTLDAVIFRPGKSNIMIIGSEML